MPVGYSIRLVRVKTSRLGQFHWAFWPWNHRKSQRHFVLNQPLHVVESYIPSLAHCPNSYLLLLLTFPEYNDVSRQIAYKCRCAFPFRLICVTISAELDMHQRCISGNSISWNKSLTGDIRCSRCVNEAMRHLKDTPR